MKESLIKKMTRLQDKLKHTVNRNITAIEEDYKANVVDLEKQYPIKDKGLLIKSGITLALVICAFFLHSIPIMSE